MPKGYHHLTKEQRCQLYILKSIGKSIDNIAEILQVHRSTLYRELKSYVPGLRAEISINNVN
jgi:IS30 family transposase